MHGSHHPNLSPHFFPSNRLSLPSTLFLSFPGGGGLPGSKHTQSSPHGGYVLPGRDLCAAAARFTGARSARGSGARPPQRSLPRRSSPSAVRVAAAGQNEPPGTEEARQQQLVAVFFPFFLFSFQKVFTKTFFQSFYLLFYAKNFLQNFFKVFLCFFIQNIFTKFSPNFYEKVQQFF